MRHHNLHPTARHGEHFTTDHPFTAREHRGWARGRRPDRHEPRLAHEHEFPGAPGGAGGPGPHGGRGHGGPGHGRRGRARRGDARLAALSVLEAGPVNGYGLIRAIAERTDDAWRPSPGTVYPTLQLLVDEGLIALDPTVAGDGDRASAGTYTLTDDGRERVEAHRQQIDALWRSFTGGRGAGGGLREAVEALMAVTGNFRFASDAQRQAAIAELGRTRRELFRILADEADATASAGEDEEPDDARSGARARR